LAWVRFSFYWN